MPTDKYEIVTSACELCTVENFNSHEDELERMPDDQNKTMFINRMLTDAFNNKVRCVVVPCDYGNDKHPICAKHLKEMLDALTPKMQEA